ncbi:extracellular solute-binding protein [Streptomyces sp. 8K308]|uniref:ABC transporter substrate-binding protein n=1 Tax=Streptomyces sp. 8K308 TaxID=2530388 RepID=UPI00140500A9|nr:extracellular solute-binding protein [Streptomyces sp. 8K308]
MDLWNSTHPDVHVELSTPAGQVRIFQRLSSALVAGTGAPDLVQVDYNNLTTLAVAGYLEDITAQATALEPEFMPSAWQQVLIDDRGWAIPQDIGPMAMYYRQDVFDAHGLTVPPHLGRVPRHRRRAERRRPRPLSDRLPGRRRLLVRLARRGPRRPLVLHRARELARRHRRRAVRRDRQLLDRTARRRTW